MSGRIIEDSSLYETWKSATEATVVLKKVDRIGNLVDEIVQGGKVVHLTPTERRINQERCISADLDFFQNGMLVPVRLIESAEDVEAIKGNPNHMTEEDMNALFKVKTLKAFTEKVEAISNPITLNRLLQIAVSDDTNATHKQVQIVQGAVETHTPAPAFNEVTTVSGPRGSM